MLVTVTGGTGFVGSHSVAAVLRAGHQVRLLDHVLRRPCGARRGRRAARGVVPQIGVLLGPCAGAALRAELIQKYTEQLMYPLYATECGLVDDVIDPARTRAAVV
jgi:acetyl-CoA carboxylase carboxyltransferase component